MLIQLLQPFFQMVYSLWMLDLGWKPLYIVRTFQVFISAAFMSFFDLLTMLAGYLITGRAYVLNVWILYFPFS